MAPMSDKNKKQAGVIGWPVSHSLSPKLHNYWLKEHHINGEYTAVATEPHELISKINTLVEQGWSGFNLTIPHKEAIIPLLHDIDPTAKQIGAVNTVIIKDGKLIGCNTDAYGFWENIRESVTHKNKAVVLGAGGAARAVIEALLSAGFAHIILTNRTRERAEALQTFHEKVSVAEWEDRDTILKDADLLVNTTSLGMTGQPPLNIDLSLLPTSAVVTDIVYKPLITPLLEAAQARGNTIIDGLGMLLHQAVPAFEAWFGVRPQVTPELRQMILQET